MLYDCGVSVAQCEAGKRRASASAAMDRCKELLEQLSQELEFHHERLQSLQAENRSLKELQHEAPIDKLMTSTSINLAASFPPVSGVPPLGVPSVPVRSSQVSFARDVHSPRDSSHLHRRSSGARGS
eukprot:Skav209161  [mRNA]  locus=scaffold1137:244573:247113:- [translate_table: standard]